LLGNADSALHRAKAEGRGTFRFFQAEVDQDLRDKRALLHDLLGAVERGELAMNYQPQARNTGEITGFESLVRWHHPARGLVESAEFIRLAEQSGQIHAIGEWALREACREAASWARPLQVGVNISAAQFRHNDFVGLVNAVLRETGLAANRLELEITEGALVGDFSRAVSNLRRLRTLGVRIAMDNFGTGYSSLSHLRAFQFNKIKIDRSFVMDLEEDPQAEAMLRGVVELAHGLKLAVVAEGVETKEQLALLRRAACDEVQGYLIGRPQPIRHYAEIVGSATVVNLRPALAS
jgi:EAL domain-containing protein (putative c-di-GMP-specific phosphodiesterase class I)